MKHSIPTMFGMSQVAISENDYSNAISGSD